MILAEIKRNIFNEDNCIGNLFIDGERICYTLEDAPRGKNIKVDGKTAIPEGVYLFKVTHSPRFNRDMILIYNKSDLTIKQSGISFSGVRIHGGNDEDDTEGCPLVAHNLTPDKLKIYGTAETLLLNIVKSKGSEGVLKVTNEPIR